jgi:3-deoxy-D-manno-octulosonic-acid transferase
VRLLYTIVLHLALPFVLVRLWWRGRAEAGYREALGERFGSYETDRFDRLIWLHAVSVGEARAAQPLVRALASAFPDHHLLMTCTTAAGRDTIRQVYGESVVGAYLPYDLPWAVQRFLEYFRPQLAILMETEVWPNLVAHCERNAVPLLLANARLSASSAAGYLRWQSLARPAFATFSAVCAQSSADAERLRALGARNVEVTGSLKFDVEPDEAKVAAGREWRRSLGRNVVLLASTREGEEEMLLKHSPADGALIVVVPRHPRRFDEVAQWAQSRRSRDPRPGAADRVHLGDTMGEMAFYFGACDVAVIGGSFAPLGGQNLIEALAVGAPVIVGPYMFNFSEATQLALQAGAALQAGDAAAAMREASALLGDERRRRKMAEAGKALCAAHRGATVRHLQTCKRLLRL